MFTSRIETEAKDLGLPVIKIDASLSEDDLANLVAHQFGLQG
jgi:hypothetical protein